MTADRLASRIEAAFEDEFGSGPSSDSDLEWYYLGYIGPEGWTAIARRLIEAGVLREVEDL